MQSLNIHLGSTDSGFHLNIPQETVLWRYVYLGEGKTSGGKVSLPSPYQLLRVGNNPQPSHNRRLSRPIFLHHHNILTFTLNIVSHAALLHRFGNSWITSMLAH